MKALIIGAGRMGLTHMAHLNLATDFAIRWTVVEPSFALRRGLGFFLPPDLLDQVRARPEQVEGTFDLAVVCSPTPHHDAAWTRFRGRAGRFFVEKPLRVRDPGEELLCGYVLLHHPLHALLKERTAGQLAAVRIQLRSNTITGPNEGWRGRKSAGGGVINEFGSHLLSMVVDLVGPAATIALDSVETVHSSDAPDRAVLSGRSLSGIPFVVDMDWSDETVRKPSYTIAAERISGASASHDFYELRDGPSRQSIAAMESASGVYLRGLDFAEQTRYFLSNDRYPDILKVAVETDRILELVA